MLLPPLSWPAAPYLTALHMGPLHPVEQVLTLVLAFGPFLLLAVVVWLRRRADRRADAAAAAGGSTGADAGSGTPGAGEDQADR